MSARPIGLVSDRDPDVKIVREVVGHAVGFTIGLASDRQVTFQTGFAEDESDAIVNARFDRIMKLADRQKAKYELVTLREELETHQVALARLDDDLVRVDHDYERSQAQLDVQMEECQRLIDETRQKSYDHNVKTGRSADRGLSAPDKQRTEALKKGISDATAAQKKNEAERDQHRQAVVAQRARYEEEIAKRSASIAAKEALLKE